MHEKNVETHYVKTRMANSVMDVFKKVLEKPGILTLEKMSPIDEFHIRGREATLEMIERAQFNRGEHILDVGCGVGGPSRWLAKLSGCRITGLDVTQEFCQVATLLAKRLGIENQVQYHHGSALDMPFDADSFDGVWMQHVNMNIENKSGLFREIHRVLKSGGKFVFYEILAGSGEALDYPVPWAQQPEISFLVNESSVKKALTDEGFTLQSWYDVTDTATAFFRKMVQQLGQNDDFVLTSKTSKISNAEAVTKNLLSNLEQGRIRVVHGTVLN